MDKQVMSFNPSANFIRTGLSVAVAVAVMSFSAQAQEVHKLEKVIVTATRTAQTVDETLAPVTVIDREEIERSQATSITELLSKTPGVQITSSGGPGSYSGIYIRGTSTAQTLILMDGQKINAGSSGTAPLEYFDPNQIERIEIVRGPRSTLYGADAVGGVINIITRKGSGSPKLTLKAGGGSRNTGEYGVHFGGENEGAHYSIGANFVETEGYDRTVTTYGSDEDKDAYRNKSISGSFSRRLDSGLETGVNIAHFEGKSEYDVNSESSPQGYPASYFNETTVNGYVSSTMTNIWDTRVEVGYLRDDQEYKGAGSPSSTKNQRYFTSWLNDILWKDDQLLTAGIDYSNDKIDASTKYEVTERYNYGVFAQNLTSLDFGDLQVGARYDKNEAYGENITGNIAQEIHLSGDMELIASYGTAFLAPSFLDLYYPNLGKSDLKPETSINAEIELKGRFTSDGFWSVNLYQNQMEDMLAYGTNGKENIAKARVRGLEVATEVVIEGWYLNANFSVLDPENRSGDNSGKTLRRRAKQLFSVSIDKAFSNWSFGGTFRGQGEAWDSDDNKINRIAGFGTIDLLATVNLSSVLKTQFKVVNLMDKEYTTSYGYLDEPLGLFATIIWSPEI